MSRSNVHPIYAVLQYYGAIIDISVCQAAHAFAKGVEVLYRPNNNTGGFAGGPVKLIRK
jgi:hypothetical protein